MPTPERSTRRISEGTLPLHIALYWKASEAVVTALLDAYPGAATVKDGRGYLPLHKAAYFKASEAVVTTLVKVDMPINVEDGSSVVKHGHARG